MTFQFVEPSGFLKHYIRPYCFMESDMKEPDLVERVIPTEGIQIMFHYKTPFLVLHPNQQGISQPRSFISGLSDSFSDVSTNGTTGVVFINFYPLGASFFFNFPLSELENQNVDLSDILKSEMTEVEDQLLQKQTILERVQVIEQFFIRRFNPIGNHDQMLIRKGIEMIKSHKGVVSAKLLSESLYTTPKTLERKFSHYIGKSTKQVIKLMRFQDVLSDFKPSRIMNLSEFAHQKGYFDQSHFIHDFKSYTGYTPKEFAQKYPNYNKDGESC
jgi:AraC-like DNA-binding protein